MRTPENRSDMHEIDVDKLKDVIGGSKGNGTSGGSENCEEYSYCRNCGIKTMVRYTAQGDPICSVCRTPFHT